MEASTLEASDTGDVVNQSLHTFGRCCRTQKARVLLEEVFPRKIVSLPEYDNLVPAQGPSQETCPREEFCSQKKKLCGGLLCKVTCHEGL